MYKVLELPINKFSTLFLNTLLGCLFRNLQTEGSDGMKQEPECNVLLVSIMNMQYDVTVDVLHTVYFPLTMTHFFLSYT